jgi:hypothetical protein
LNNFYCHKTVYSPKQCTLCRVEDRWVCNNTNGAMQGMQKLALFLIAQFVYLGLESGMKSWRILIVHKFVLEVPTSNQASDGPSCTPSIVPHDLELSTTHFRLLIHFRIVQYGTDTPTFTLRNSAHCSLFKKHYKWVTITEFLTLSEKTSCINIYLLCSIITN